MEVETVSTAADLKRKEKIELTSARAANYNHSDHLAQCPITALRS